MTARTGVAVRLTLPIPPSTNNLYWTRNGKRVKTTAARDYADLAELETILALTKVDLPVTPNGSYEVTIWLYMPDKRRRDVDNIKVLLDSVCAGIGVDDSRVFDLHVHKRLDRANPRAVVTLCASEGVSDA